MAKAKWLEEGTDAGLLNEVLGTLTGDLEKKEVNRAIKAVEELIERAPVEGEEPSVEEAILALQTAFTSGIEKITKAYETELEEISGDLPEDEDEIIQIEEEEEEEEGMTLRELRAECKAKGLKGLKGLKKEDLIALLNGEEIEEEELPEDLEYEDMTIKELRTECRSRGIKVVKGMKKAEFIEALEADDKE